MTYKYNKEQQVVISGLGIFTPLGRNAEQIGEAVLNGENSIAQSKNIDTDQLISNLTSEFLTNDTFDLNSAFTQQTDRGVWFTVKALEEALKSAGLEKGDIVPARTAVVVGTSHSGIQHVEKVMKSALFNNGQDIDANDFYAALTDHVATQICESLNLSNIKVTISSACSSSNTAIGYARDILLAGDADRVIVVGTDTLSESIAAGFNALKVMSKTPAAPFSSPSGITLGEGAGVLIMETLASTEHRNHKHRGEVLGYALSSDAFHQTSVDENGSGIASAITHALDNAGVGVGDVDYISAHGTGTDSNDVPESKAVERLFGNNIKISSVKSCVGHTLGASGVVELIISLVCAEKGFYAPSCSFTEPREGCADLDYVHGKQESQENINTILCNNYGFGGNNSSTVLSMADSHYPNSGLANERVYITGYGDCLGDELDSDWTATDNIESRLSCNDEEFNTFIGKVTLPKGKKSGARRSSPSIQFSLKAMEKAVGDSELSELVNEQRYETGIVAGLLHGAQKSLEKYMKSVYEDGLGFASSTQFPLTTLNAAAGAVSIKYGIKGFNTTLCGPVGSLKFAFDTVKNGHQERMFNFSSDELTPMVMQLANQFGVLGHFENGRPSEGFYLAEGASLSLLESGAALNARGATPLAELVALKVSQDGSGHQLPGNGKALANTAKAALEQAGLNQSDVDLVIGVGQGTEAFMDNERNALAELFDEKQPTLTSAAMHLGYSPSAILPQMVNLGTSILQGSAFWSVDNTSPIWQPKIRLESSNITNVLVLFTSVTFEHCALIMRKVD